MGGMADYDLEEVVTMEGLRNDYVNGHMSQEQAFDHGFIDPLGVETKHLGSAWKDYNRSFDTDDELTRAKLEWSTSENYKEVEEYNKAYQQKTRPIVDKIIKRAKTVQFLKGFAEFYYNQGYLTDKQKKVVETNWEGGSDKFLKDCDNVDMVQKLDQYIDYLTGSRNTFNL